MFTLKKWLIAKVQFYMILGQQGERDCKIDELQVEELTHNLMYKLPGKIIQITENNFFHL